MAGDELRMRGAAAWEIERGGEAAEAYTRDDVAVGPDGTAWRMTEVGGDGSAVVASRSWAVRGYVAQVAEPRRARARRRVVRPAPKPGGGREATLDTIEACPACRGDAWPDCEGCGGRCWVWRERHGDS